MTREVLIIGTSSDIDIAMPLVSFHIVFWVAHDWALTGGFNFDSTVNFFY